MVLKLRGLFGPAALAFTAALTEAGFVASDAISGTPVNHLEKQLVTVHLIIC